MSVDRTTLAPHEMWKARFYNGFSPEARASLGRYASRAMKAGKLERPTSCHACGRQDGVMLAHLEDYQAWGDHFGMCVACHKALHERFRNPALFRAWIAMLEAGERAVVWHDYNWSRWDRLYRFTPVEQWRTEPADRAADLTLFNAVSTVYLDRVPAHLHRMGGAPLLSCQHHGRIGPSARIAA